MSRRRGPRTVVKSSSTWMMSSLVFCPATSDSAARRQFWTSADTPGRATRIPPAHGMQLQLAGHHGRPIDDTLVVKNLGYLQFKATPARLSGREFSRTPTMKNGSPPESSIISLRSESPPCFLGKSRQHFIDVIGKTETGVSTQRHAEMNIFTVPSGAAVLEIRVDHDRIFPQFAQEYGFQCELVTYKWSTWLRQQHERRRSIWEYKVLFLDVLFPMDLDRATFIDADQFVRTDRKEPIELDFHRIPYRYTMGDGNEGMEGFQFWKMGYCEPYHIRGVAALPVWYRSLIDWPGSVLISCAVIMNNLRLTPINLDQGHVPICRLHVRSSLCMRTGYGMTLLLHKTFILVRNVVLVGSEFAASQRSNPDNRLGGKDSKEPKLARTRQIPEWEQYDAEISRPTPRLANEGRTHASAAAADVNELAKAGGRGNTSPCYGRGGRRGQRRSAHRTHPG
ncbi:hypothetical protein EDB84DRAFT_1442382 [Lactarius hengduanensis]|nr:hypothetical protein EDB84DRAFT_1442382 [Lactarius hengduanensis]